MRELTPSLLEGLPSTGPTDPIRFYRKPLVGWLFRERINRGLRLLPQRRLGRVLEIGYGAGAVMVALAGLADELHGIDLDAPALQTMATLERLGIHAHLRRENVYDLSDPAQRYGLVVSFSVFEHLHQPAAALAQVHRVLEPGGLFLLGMPEVNRVMELGFAAIGFRGIGDHHVTTPGDVENLFTAAGFRVAARSGLGRRLPGMQLYHHWLLEKV